MGHTPFAHLVYPRRLGATLMHEHIFVLDTEFQQNYSEPVRLELALVTNMCYKQTFVTMKEFSR